MVYHKITIGVRNNESSGTRKLLMRDILGRGTKSINTKKISKSDILDKVNSSGVRFINLSGVKDFVNMCHWRRPSNPKFITHRVQLVTRMALNSFVNPKVSTKNLQPSRKLDVSNSSQSFEYRRKFPHKVSVDYSSFLQTHNLTNIDECTSIELSLCRIYM